MTSSFPLSGAVAFNSFFVDELTNNFFSLPLSLSLSLSFFFSFSEQRFDLSTLWEHDRRGNSAWKNRGRG